MTSRLGVCRCSAWMGQVGRGPLPLPPGDTGYLLAGKGHCVTFLGRSLTANHCPRDKEGSSRGVGMNGASPRPITC